IAEVWDYLIHVEPKEVLGWPLLQEGQSGDDLTISRSARYLIGLWCNVAGTTACKRLSKWAIQHPDKAAWGEKIRARIAAQVPHIGHWRWIHGDSSCARDTEATWFIAPPYVGAGVRYRCSSKQIDFAELGWWCQTRLGQAIVCENVGATWL